VDPVNATRAAVTKDVCPKGELSTSEAVAETVAGTTVAGVASATTGLARSASKRGYNPKLLDFTKNNPNLYPLGLTTVR